MIWAFNNEDFLDYVCCYPNYVFRRGGREWTKFGFFKSRQNLALMVVILLTLNKYIYVELNHYQDPHVYERFNSPCVVCQTIYFMIHLEYHYGRERSWFQSKTKISNEPL